MQGEHSEACQQCKATGANWASKRMHDQPQTVQADRVWLEAEAEEAFTRTETAQDCTKGSDSYNYHRRGFVSGAVSRFETARNVRQFGVAID